MERSDKRKQEYIQWGYACNYRNDLCEECRHVVLNLGRNLLSLHKFDRCFSKYEDLIVEAQNEKYLKRSRRMKTREDTNAHSSYDLDKPNENLFF